MSVLSAAALCSAEIYGLCPIGICICGTAYAGAEEYAGEGALTCGIETDGLSGIGGTVGAGRTTAGGTEGATGCTVGEVGATDTLAKSGRSEKIGEGGVTGLTISRGITGATFGGTMSFFAGGGKGTLTSGFGEGDAGTLRYIL